MKPPRYRRAAKFNPFRCRNCHYMGRGGRCVKYNYQVGPKYTCSSWRPV